MPVTKYKLPKWINNGEEVSHYGAMVGSWPMVYFDSGECIALHPNLLTKVETPLPPEPGAGRVLVVVTPPVGDDEVFRRKDGRWWSVSEFQQEGLPWAQLHEIGEVTVLRPDPVDAAPELPMLVTTAYGTGIDVRREGKLLRFVQGAYCADVRMDVAVQGALAVLRAAREAEQP